MNSLISIIVPIYNSEKYLGECLESILNQEYINLEVILINDGSTDNSIDICNHYKGVDNRVVVVDVVNSGVSAARNLGIRIATGDYIGFVDSDDYINPNMFSTLMSKIEHDDSDICVMAYYTINQKESEIFSKFINQIDGKEALRELLLLRFPSSLWAYLYKKEFIKNTNLDESIHFFEDFAFNVNILSSVRNVSICYDKLYTYRINLESINHQYINDKKMTCLDIYPKIKHKLICMDQYILYFRAHFLSSVIISVLKSPTVESKYFEAINVESRSLFKLISKSKLVPIKFKIGIGICTISSKLLYKIYGCKRLIIR
jgi:glycosyltransferase involved in cell wall biosynthesis